MTLVNFENTQYQHDNGDYDVTQLQRNDNSYRGNINLWSKEKVSFVALGIFQLLSQATAEVIDQEGNPDRTYVHSEPNPWGFAIVFFAALAYTMAGGVRI